MKKRKYIEREQKNYSDIEIKLHGFVTSSVDHFLLSKGHKMEMELAKLLEFLYDVRSKIYQDEED